MEELPKRRRWSFTLRTLFVLVTVLAVFVGWVGEERKFVRERNQFLRQIGQQLEVEQFGGDDREIDMAARETAVSYGDVTLPFWRRLLGDTHWNVIYLPADFSAESRDKATALFPEAEFASYELPPIPR